jgi:hypothetical protein
MGPQPYNRNCEISWITLSMFARAVPSVASRSRVTPQKRRPFQLGLSREQQGDVGTAEAAAVGQEQVERGWH